MKRAWMGLFLFIIVCCMGERIFASDAETLMEELDFSEIDRFLENEENAPLSFEEMIRNLLKGGEVPYETVGDYLKSMLLAGFAEHKKLVLGLLVACIAFSILKSYAKIFSNSYISETCFFLCYAYMMTVLLQSFSEMNETVTGAAEQMTSFMKALIPTYCMAISFTMNINSSATAYTLLFAAIYLVEWLTARLLVPLVQIYIVLQFLNHLMEEERFRRLTELIADAVRFLLKAMVTFILGINIIQGMVAPAIDRLTGNTIMRTIQMVPGLGNVANGMGQIFLSSGLVIKNCVGAAALLILACLCAAPLLKMGMLAAIYKLLSAVLEPISDKRLSGGLNGIANGGMLYIKILCACVMMFVLTIALTCAATGLAG